MAGTQPSDEARRLIGVEGNLEDLPLGTLNAGRGGLRRIEHCWDESYVDSSGREREVSRRWAVEGSEKFGLPGEKEQDIYVALLELIAARGGIPEDGRASFSVYELLEIMGDHHGGDHYARVRNGLRTIARTTIESRRAFYSPRLKTHISDEFQLFTLSWAEVEDLDGNRLRDRHSLLFHPYFVESYNDAYHGRLDAEFYWSLKRPTSRRLYRLLDRRAAEKRDGGPRCLEMDLGELQALMPLLGRPSKVMGILATAEAELLRKGFLDRAESVDLRRGKKRGRILVKYRLSKRFAQRTFSKKIDLSPAEEAAVEQLVYWKISRPRAIEEVLTRGPEHCERWAAMAHFQPGIDHRNAGGLLIKALEEQYEWWEPNMEKALASNTPPATSRSVPPDVLEKARGRARSAHAAVPGSCTPPRESGPEQAPDPEAGRIWQEVLRRLKDSEPNEESAHYLQVWFQRTFGAGLRDGELVVAVPTSYSLEYIERRFMDPLLRRLREVLSPAATLRLVVLSETEERS